MAFIDRMTQEHEEAIYRLQEKNDQLRAELEDANEALAAVGDNTENEKALADAQSLIADLRTQNEALEDRVKALEAELNDNRSAQKEEPTVPMCIPQDLADPIPPVAEVLPVSVSPSKDYTELELAAYRRAELTESLSAGAIGF